MENFYLTFGVAYNHNPHPSGEDVSGKGWVRIVAPTYDEAREIAKGYYGLEWAFLTPEKRFPEKSKNYYPHGEIACLGS